MISIQTLQYPWLAKTGADVLRLKAIWILFNFSPWWRHQMETFSAILAICVGSSPVPVNSPHKGQWRGALMFSLICVWINEWINNRKAGDLRRHRGHYDVTAMLNWGCLNWVFFSSSRIWCNSRTIFINLSVVCCCTDQQNQDHQKINLLDTGKMRLDIESPGFASHMSMASYK